MQKEKIIHLVEMYAVFITSDAADCQQTRIDKTNVFQSLIKDNISMV